MPHSIRSLAVAGALLALGAGIAGCSSSSGSDGAAPTTTTAPVERTTTTTTPDTTTTGDTTTTDPDAPTTTAAASDGPLDCQALLQEYADVFDPDDLAETVEFFRTYEPDMPDDVAAATERLAVAYEEAGDLGNLDMGSVDLTADAQTFSDWTNDGCPAG